MESKKSDIQKKFTDVDQAFRYANSLAQKSTYVHLIQSIDNLFNDKIKNEICYFVENYPSMIRNWEKVEYTWENGELMNQS